MIKAIYSIKNEMNKRIYIGESMNIAVRWDQHQKELASGEHVNKDLQKYYNENFKFDIEILLDESVILDSTDEKILLLILEKKTINKYKELGYTVLNKEDSLLKVLTGDKKLFPNDVHTHSEEYLMNIYKNVKYKLENEFKQIGSLIYSEHLKLKDFYSMGELIKARVLEKDVDGYKIAFWLSKYIIKGDSYSTYVVNEKGRDVIEKILDEEAAIARIENL